MDSLDGQVVLVTGASSGIGEATALACAERGATVVATARRADRLESLAAQVPGRIVPEPANIADRAAVEAIFSRIERDQGRLDVIVNNAGIMPLAPMKECRVDEWDDMIDVNIKGLLYGIAGALPIMRRQKTGHIINVSSVAGRRAIPTAAVYCGTKFAVHAISEGLRQELSGDGAEDGNRIRVTVIAPGVVVTELVESVRHDQMRDMVRAWYDTMEGPLRSQDIADAILFAIESPPHVNINEILVRPTTQAR